MIRRPPRSTRTVTLFPHPTLFRSGLVCPLAQGSEAASASDFGVRAAPRPHSAPQPFSRQRRAFATSAGGGGPAGLRSRPCPGERAGDGQAVAGDRGGRRSQPVDERSARGRPVPARRLPAGVLPELPPSGEIGRG